MTTSDSQLENMMKNEPSFNGVYASDELPYPLKIGSYIMNLDNHDKKGSHWTCLINYGKKLLYMDPLTLDPQEIHQKQFKKQFGKHVYYNKILIEPLLSKRCGQYCVDFLKHGIFGFDYAIKYLNENNLLNK